MIRNLIRAAAALPLGAFALTALPFGTAYAAQNDKADWTISGYCSGSEYLWLVKIDSVSAEPIVADFTSEDGQHLSATVAPGLHHELVLYGVEGAASTVHFRIDDVEVDSETTSLVDCIAGENPSASIKIVCPAVGSDEDIYADYTLSSPDATAELKWVTPDGSSDQTALHAEVKHVTYKVEQGQAIDVWVKMTHGGNTLATLNTTVDCDLPEVSEEGPADTPEQTTEVQADMPHTGIGSDLARIAAALTAAGAGAMRMSRRKVAIAE